MSIIQKFPGVTFLNPQNSANNERFRRPAPQGPGRSPISPQIPVVLFPYRLSLNDVVFVLE